MQKLKQDGFYSLGFTHFSGGICTDNIIVLKKNIVFKDVKRLRKSTIESHANKIKKVIAEIIKENNIDVLKCNAYVQCGYIGDDFVNCKTTCVVSVYYPI